KHLLRIGRHDRHRRAREKETRDDRHPDPERSEGEGSPSKRSFAVSATQDDVPHHLSERTAATVRSTSSDVFMIPHATRANGTAYGVVEAMILFSSSLLTVCWGRISRRM